MIKLFSLILQAKAALLLSVLQGFNSPPDKNNLS
jgi:hypothetical protein